MGSCRSVRSFAFRSLKIRFVNFLIRIFVNFMWGRRKVVPDYVL